ncbi:helix-turn-helix domain-containing protein [Streptomyces sp. KLOTTS4A1]|uniref:helix-turn-helix domain-containing protein n=1 Tax=Streptomyces sp. KLOTTS4A1 TaxID=3390996 RepID=UPI0039F45085
MDTQHPSAPAHPQSPVTADDHPPARRPGTAPTVGVLHDNVRITDRFTVISNDLAQHPSLSLTAVGLSTYIQSLPAGSRIDIRTLSARWPEGDTRIATALRELETHGFLRREVHRTPDGRVATRTVSCNRPGGRRNAPRAASKQQPAPVADTDRGPDADRGPDPDPDRGPAPASVSPSASTHAPGPAPMRAPTPEQRPKKPPNPLHVPHPAYPSPTLLQQATALLATLHRNEPRLLLSATDTARLAPGVAAWLERDISPAAVRQALTADLPPQGVRHPAAFLAHRLSALLPPAPPLGAPRPSASEPAKPHPLRNCDTCDHAYRGPTPGECPPCSAARQLAGTHRGS